MMPKSTHRIDFFCLVCFFISSWQRRHSLLHVLERLHWMAVLRPQGPIGSVEAIAQMHMDRSM